MNVFEWLQSIIPADLPPLIKAVGLAIIFAIVFDVYHLLFSGVFSWLKK